MKQYYFHQFEEKMCVNGKLKGYPIETSTEQKKKLG